MILKNPEIGIKISGTEARGKLVKDYDIIYINLKNSIEIISVFDTRQNPEKLKKILGWPFKNSPLQISKITKKNPLNFLRKSTVL